MVGYVKLNFDGGCIGHTFSGQGFAIRDHDGNISPAAVKHTKGAATAIIEEVQACLYALECTYDHGLRIVIIEGLQLIQMLKSRSPTDSLISFFLKDIFSFLGNFDFYSLSFLKRGGNKIAHDLAH